MENYKQWETLKGHHFEKESTLKPNSNLLLLLRLSDAIWVNLQESRKTVLLKNDFSRITRANPSYSIDGTEPGLDTSCWT